MKAEVDQMTILHKQGSSDAHTGKEIKADQVREAGKYYIHAYIFNVDGMDYV